MADASRLIRPMALLALVAMLLAQSVAPALKGVAMGMDRMIDVFDVVAGVGSHLLAIATTAIAIGLVLLIARDGRVNLVVRVLLIAQTTVVLVLGVPAARFRLSAFACFFLGLVACGLALVAAVEGMREPRSRAAGLVLGATAVAALMRMVPAAILSLSDGSRAESFAPVASWLATGSVLLFGASVFVTLAWVAARGRKLVSPVSLLALGSATMLAWGALRGARPHASSWSLFLARAMDELATDPGSLLPPVVEHFIIGLAPITALAVLASRRQIPSVVGALALTVTAGAAPDIPGRALILTIAALSVVLASRDDHGMWAALIGHPLASGPRSSDDG